MHEPLDETLSRIRLFIGSKRSKMAKEKYSRIKMTETNLFLVGR